MKNEQEKEMTVHDRIQRFLINFCRLLHVIIMLYQPKLTIDVIEESQPLPFSSSCLTLYFLQVNKHWTQIKIHVSKQILITTEWNTKFLTMLIR